MSKKEKTTSKYLNSIEDKEHKKNKKNRSWPYIYRTARIPIEET